MPKKAWKDRSMAFKVVDVILWPLRVVVIVFVLSALIRYVLYLISGR